MFKWIDPRTHSAVRKRPAKTYGLYENSLQNRPVITCEAHSKSEARAIFKAKIAAGKVGGNPNLTPRISRRPRLPVGVVVCEVFRWTDGSWRMVSK